MVEGALAPACPLPSSPEAVGDGEPASTCRHGGRQADWQLRMKSGIRIQPYTHAPSRQWQVSDSKAPSSSWEEIFM